MTADKENAVGSSHRGLDTITRDVVTIVAALVTLIAFGFAIWATVVTKQQSQRVAAHERIFIRSMERMEESVLERIDKALA